MRPKGSSIREGAGKRSGAAFSKRASNPKMVGEIRAARESSSIQGDIKRAGRMMGVGIKPAGFSHTQDVLGRLSNIKGSGVSRSNSATPKSTGPSRGPTSAPSRTAPSKATPSTAKSTGPSRGPTSAPSRTQPSKASLGTSRFSRGGAVKRQKK